MLGTKMVQLWPSGKPAHMKEVFLGSEGLPCAGGTDVLCWWTSWKEGVMA